MLTKNELIELSKVHGAFCVSIFIPTTRAGEDAINGKDKLNLKNQLRFVKNKLQKDGMPVDKIENFVKPIEDLLLDNKFWKYQSDGLAIFLSEGFFTYYTVPVYFKEYSILSNNFYVRPLLYLFNDDGLFYVLTLTTSEVKLFEGTRHTFTKIDIKDLVPGQLEDVVGYDYEQKNLQHRSQSGMNSGTLIHGQGEANAKVNSELKHFLNEVDKGITKLFHEDQRPPLILACVENIYGMYAKVNTYTNLFPKHIKESPSHLEDIILHEKAWLIVEDYFTQFRKEKLEKFNALLGTGKTATQIDEIIPAALDGKIETLFIENLEDVFGTYDPEKRLTTIADNEKQPNVSLLNLAAINVIEKGGNVFILDKEEIPEGIHQVFAIYRF